MMCSVLVLSMFWQQFGIGCQCNIKSSLVHLHKTAAVSYVCDKIINQYFTIMQTSSHIGENISSVSVLSQYASVLQISFHGMKPVSIVRLQYCIREHTVHPIIQILHQGKGT